MSNIDDTGYIPSMFIPPQPNVSTIKTPDPLLVVATHMMQAILSNPGSIPPIAGQIIRAEAIAQTACADISRCRGNLGSRVLDYAEALIKEVEKRSQQDDK